MSAAHWAGLLLLLAFGLLFDDYVGAQIAAGRGDFTARYVIIGCAVTILVLVLDSGGQTYTAAKWGVFTYAHFAAAGIGMTLGSWERRHR